MPLDAFTRAITHASNHSPVADLDVTEQLARVLAEIDGCHRYATDPLVAELYLIEAAVLLPAVLAACCTP